MVDISYRNSLILNNHQFERQPSLRGLIDDYYSDDTLVLRWRRLISPDIAEIMNCAVLSPSSLNFSIESTSSCGTRASNFFDFAFTAFVAISASISSWWLTVYAKNFYKKELTWLTLKNTMVADTMLYSGDTNSNAPKCANTVEASDHNIIGANAMADTQSNQTRLKFTFLITSDTQRLADMSSLIFALRQGAYYE
ncbi:hypothetical protein Xekk_03536 [Xenorhabdus sp. KK7.4]|nr:hypothetical protein Xekk_03536 [Xenorhabdus sp. KK7.4]